MLCALAFALLSGQSLTAQVDPRLKNDYRVDNQGWIYLHLAGEPKDIGYAYGTLLSTEIDDAQKTLQLQLKRDTGKNWNFYRETAKKLFWPHVPTEYQAELSGQAEGLQAKGLKYDTWDVLAFNSYIELSQYYLPWLAHQPSHKESCSAFIATGSQTTNGQIVMGHEMWWDYLMGERFNAVLDITPTHGNRIVMDSLCGFIHSGTDFAMNSKGMALCETTISGFEGFDPGGVPEFVRMRQSIQYSGSLDELVKIMKDRNNGGYANTWLIGDTKTNEIGKLELGLKNVTFDRKSDGAYVGANFPESAKLIAEEVPGGWDKNPATNGCEQRRVRFNHLLGENVRQVDEKKGEEFLADTFNEATGKDEIGTNTLCGNWKPTAGGAVNAKVLTSASVAKMQFWGRMGIPNGSTFDAKSYFKTHPQDVALTPYLRDIERHEWTVFPPQK
jgi:hypothetical protein